MPVAKPCARPPQPVAKARVQPSQPARPPQRAPVALNPWDIVWNAVTKYTAAWTQEQCAKLKDFLREAGLRRKVAHATKVIAANRDAPLKWREDVDYGRGRNPQGGGNPPFVVKRSSLIKYYEHVVRHGA